MKKSTKVLLSVAAVAAVGAAAFIISQQKKRRRLKHIAEEGYETAHDVLYPQKSVSPRLKYGPVLPE